MMIDNAMSAAEFTGAWLREARPRAAVRYIGFAIEGQQRCAAISRSRGRALEAAGHDAAIAVLQAGAAEAQRLVDEQDAVRTWAGFCGLWADVGCRERARARIV